MPGWAPRWTIWRRRRSRPAPWCRCRLGRRSVTGIVWPRRVGEPAGAAQLRPVQEAMLSLPPLGPAWMQLVEFSAAYYQRSIGEVALSVLPPELRKLDDARMGNRLERLRRMVVGRVAARCRAVPAATDRRAGGGRRRARRLAAWRHHADAAAGRHRQRQDRGLSAQRGTCLGPGAPGAGAGARDQPDAAARGAFCRAICRPPPGLAAQRPDAGAAPAPLAAGPPGARRPGAGHAVGGVCVDAAAGPDRRRRGTRPVVQAAGGRALFGPRPGHLSRPRRRAAGAAGLGHAVAGKLVARRTGPLSPAEPDAGVSAGAACPRCACST